MRAHREEAGGGGVCAECGQDPVDVRATRDRRWHGGNRLALRLWLILLLLVAVAALPWTQQRLGNRSAIFDYGDKPFPPHEVAQPMFDPLVTARDLELAASGDADAIGALREGVLAQGEVAQRYLHVGPMRARLAVLHDRWRERTARMAQRGQEGTPARRVGETTMTSYGWPLTWAMRHRDEVIVYEEGDFRGDDWGSAPAPALSRTIETRWSGVQYVNILSTLIVLCGAGACAGWVLRRVGASRRRAARVGWGLALVLVAGVLAKGMLAPRVVGPRLSWGAVGFEALGAGAGPERGVDELMGLAADDEGVAELARETLEACGEMDRPNAVVGLLRRDEVGRSPHWLQYGLWGSSPLRVLMNRYWAFETLAKKREIEVPDWERELGFRFHWGNMGLLVAPGERPMTSYMVSLNLRELLVWGLAAWVVLRLLRLVILPLYRIKQRRHRRGGGCVWCGYPVEHPAEADVEKLDM